MKTFVKVCEKHYKFLYDLLLEREDHINISHKKVPSYENHIRFVESNPYRVWYVIEVDGRIIGSIYLSKSNEIGIFILKSHQKKGYGKTAIIKLLSMYPGERILANINPGNEVSINLFKKIGFFHIQNTYEMLT